MIETKTASKSRHFAYGFRPIHYFARICGQMPFTITSGACVATKMFKRDLIWLAISLCIQILFIYLAVVFLKSTQDPNAHTYNLYFGNLIGWFLILLLGICMMVLDACNCFKITRILNEFTSFDEEMARFGIYFDYKMENQRAWLCCAIIMLINLFLLVLTFHRTYDYYMDSYSLLNIIEYVSTYIHHSLILTAPSVTYVYLLCNLQKRYAILNQLLRNRILNSNSANLSSATGKKHMITAVKFIGRHHSHLTKIMDLMNFCCSFQIMVTTAFTFGLSVLTFYTFYRYIVQQNEYFRDFALVHVHFQIYYLTMILFIVYNANRVINEGKRTAHIVYDKINCCNDSDVSFSLTQLSLQVQNRHPIATCGLFPFDWTLLFTMAAAATTYLTILLNFGSQPDACRNQTMQNNY